MSTNTLGTVLVVDDDDDTREVLRLNLQQEGFLILEAADGQAAIKILRGSGGLPNVVVLDISMPRRDGVWVLEHKARDPRLAAVPVIVWSAAAERELPQLAGVEAVLTKAAPFARIVSEVKRAAGSEPLLRRSH